MLARPAAYPASIQTLKPKFAPPSHDLLTMELEARHLTFLRMLECLGPNDLVTNNTKLHTQFKSMLIMLAHELFSAKRRWYKAEVAALEEYVAAKKLILKEALLLNVSVHIETLKNSAIELRSEELLKLALVPFKEFAIAIRNYLLVKAKVSPGSHAFAFSNEQTTQKYPQNNINFETAIKTLVNVWAEDFEHFSINNKALIGFIENAWQALSINEANTEFNILIEDEIALFEFHQFDQIKKIRAKDYDLLCQQANLVAEKAKIIELSEMYIDYNAKFYALLNDTIQHLQQAIPEASLDMLSQIYLKAFEKFRLQPEYFLNNFLCEMYLQQVRRPAVQYTNLKNLEGYIAKVNLYYAYVKRAERIDIHTLRSWVNSDKFNYFEMRSLQTLIYDNYRQFHNIKPLPGTNLAAKKMLISYASHEAMTAKSEAENDTHEVEIKDSTRNEFASAPVRIHFADVENLMKIFPYNKQLLFPKNIEGEILPLCLDMFNEEVKWIYIYQENFAKFNKPRSLALTQKERSLAIDLFNSLLTPDTTIEMISALLFVAEPYINQHSLRMPYSIWAQGDTNTWSNLLKVASNHALADLPEKITAMEGGAVAIDALKEYYRFKYIFKSRSAGIFGGNDTEFKFNALFEVNNPTLRV